MLNWRIRQNLKKLPFNFVCDSSKRFYSRPQLSHSTKLQSSATNPPPPPPRPPSSSAIHSQTLSASMNIRPNSSSRQPTELPPTRNSARPGAAAMSTDAVSAAANSILVGTYTKPGWQSTTEPGFITSHNSITNNYGSKPPQPWQFTTEPNFVTRVKAKPNASSFKPKPKPTKKPILYTTKYGTKTTKGTTTKR